MYNVSEFVHINYIHCDELILHDNNNSHDNYNLISTISANYDNCSFIIFIRYAILCYQVSV